MNRSEFIKEIKKLGYKRNYFYMRNLISKYGSKDNLPNQRWLNKHKAFISGDEYDMVLSKRGTIFENKSDKSYHVQVFKCGDQSQTYSMSTFRKTDPVWPGEKIYEVVLNEIKEKNLYSKKYLRDNKIKEILGK